MNKKISIIVFYLLFFIVVVPLIFSVMIYSPISYSQTISLSDRKVIYELPFPGILPDNPIYPIKMVRDRLLDIMTRDNMKKAELFFLYSDKRVAMAITLANTGKAKLAVSTLTKAEKYFEKIPNLLKNAKEQGVAPAENLLYKLKLSNDKHREIIDDIAKQIPQGQEKDIESLLKLNSQIKKDLSNF